MRPRQCEGGLYLTVADSHAPLPHNNNTNDVLCTLKVLEEAFRVEYVWIEDNDLKIETSHI